MDQSCAHKKDGLSVRHANGMEMHGIAERSTVITYAKIGLSVQHANGIAERSTVITYAKIGLSVQHEKGNGKGAMRGSAIRSSPAHQKRRERAIVGKGEKGYVITFVQEKARP